MTDGSDRTIRLRGKPIKEDAFGYLCLNDLAGFGVVVEGGSDGFIGRYGGVV